MIDRKKLVQRLNKGSRLREFPLLNLYILVAAGADFAGRAADWGLLLWLRPLPLLLMVLYLHSKNAARKHLVPSLVEWALIGFLAEALLAFLDAPAAIAAALSALAHVLYAIALSFGDRVRALHEWEWVRAAGYLVVAGGSAGGLYAVWETLPGRWACAGLLAAAGAQVWVSLWRYEITLRSSFVFSLCGSAVLLGCAWAGVWAGGLALALVHLLRNCAHYFLMHGSLHQSNLQFEIDKLHDNFRRNY